MAVGIYVYKADLERGRAWQSAFERRIVCVQTRDITVCVCVIFSFEKLRFFFHPRVLHYHEPDMSAKTTFWYAVVVTLAVVGSTMAVPLATIDAPGEFRCFRLYFRNGHSHFMYLHNII